MDNFNTPVPCEPARYPGRSVGGGLVGGGLVAGRILAALQ